MDSEKPITIAIIKPDQIKNDKKEEIIEQIKERGYEILEQKTITFTEEMAHEFYQHQKEQVFNI